MYFVSALYFVPQFRRKLQEWFPSGRVAEVVSRVLFHPDNDVWARATAVAASLRRQQGLVVGVQQRGPYQNSTLTAQHVAGCFFAPNNTGAAAGARRRPGNVSLLGAGPRPRDPGPSGAWG